MTLGTGSQVHHTTFGAGVVVNTTADYYTIYFNTLSETREIATNYQGLEVINAKEPSQQLITLADVEAAIENIFWKMERTEETVNLASKWLRGKLVLHPSDSSMATKEIPMDNFFNKIVMLRDRLRVLEQNINSHTKLNNDDKVHMQQYITRCYGSLTTFNVLFRDSWQQFKGAGKDD